MELIAFVTEPSSATAPALLYLLHLTAMDGGNAGDCQEQSLPCSRMTVSHSYAQTVGATWN